MCAWEKWKGDIRGSGPAARHACYLSIYKSGAISFSKAAERRFSITIDGFVETYFDKETKRLGFRFYESSGSHRHKMKHIGTGRLGFNAPAVLKHFGIDFVYSRRFHLAREDMLIVTEPVVLAKNAAATGRE